MTKVKGVYLNNVHQVVNGSTNLIGKTTEELQQDVFITNAGVALEYSGNNVWEASTNFTGQLHRGANFSTAIVLDVLPTNDSAIAPSILVERPIYSFHTRYWDARLQDVFNNYSNNVVVEIFDSNSSISNHIAVYLNARNVLDGVEVPYTISGNNITSKDISNAPLSGVFSISNNIGVINLEISNDFVSEGPEVLYVTLATGEAISITILDTSTDLYIISTNSITNTFDEGVVFIVTLTANQHVIDGTEVQYTLSGQGITPEDFGLTSLTGLLNIYNDVGHCYIPISKDKLDEGLEHLTFTVLDSLAIDITINDTSTLSNNCVYAIEIVNSSTGLRLDIPSGVLIGLEFGPTPELGTTTIWANTPENATSTSSFEALMLTAYQGFANVSNDLSAIAPNAWKLLASTSNNADGLLIAPDNLETINVKGLGSTALVKVTKISDAIPKEALSYSNTINLMPSYQQNSSSSTAQSVNIAIGSDPIAFIIGQAITINLDGIPYSYVCSSVSKLDAVIGLMAIINTSTTFVATHNGQQSYTHLGITYNSEVLCITSLIVNMPFTFSSDNTLTSQLYQRAYDPIVDPRLTSLAYFRGDFNLLYENTLIDLVPFKKVVRLVLPVISIAGNYYSSQNDVGGIRVYSSKNLIVRVPSYQGYNEYFIGGDTEALVVPSSVLSWVPDSNDRGEAYIGYVLLDVEALDEGLYTLYISSDSSGTVGALKPYTYNINKFLELRFQVISNFDTAPSVIVPYQVGASTINDNSKQYYKYTDEFAKDTLGYFLFNDYNSSTFLNSADAILSNLAGIDVNVNCYTANVGTNGQYESVLHLGNTTPSILVVKNTTTYFDYVMDSVSKTHYPLISGDMPLCIEGFFYPTVLSGTHFLLGTTTSTWQFIEAPHFGNVDVDVTTTNNHLHCYPLFCAANLDGSITLSLNTEKKKLVTESLLSNTNYYESVAITSITSIPGIVKLNSWVHIALVRGLGAYTVYANGVEVCSLCDNNEDIAPSWSFPSIGYRDQTTHLYSQSQIGDTIRSGVCLGGNFKQTSENIDSTIFDGFVGYAKLFRTTNKHARYTGTFSKFSPISNTLIPTNSPSYKIITQDYGHNEGEAKIFTVVTSNVEDGTVLTLEYASSDANLGSYFSVAPSTITITNNGAVLEPIIIANPVIADNVQYFIRVFNAGVLVANSANITLVTYRLTPSTTITDEGTSVVMTLTSNVPDNTVVPYTITSNLGVLVATNATNTEGIFTVIGGTATSTIQIINDQIDEGFEILTVHAKGATSTFSINDTSIAAWHNFDSSLIETALPVYEGSAYHAYLSITTPTGTDLVPAGTVVGVGMQKIYGGYISVSITTPTDTTRAGAYAQFQEAFNANSEIPDSGWYLSSTIEVSMSGELFGPFGYNLSTSGSTALATSIIVNSNAPHPAIAQVSKLYIGHPNMVIGEITTINLNGTNITYTSTSTDVTEIATAIVGALNTVSGYNALYTGILIDRAVIQIESLTAGIPFTCTGTVF